MEKEAFPTFDTMMQAVSLAQDDGWHRLPYDEPAFGEIGLLLFRPSEVGGLGEDSRRLVWRPFGELQQDMTVCDSEELVDLLAAFDGSPTAVKMDDARQRRLGVVHYDRPGYATGLHFSLTAVKACPTAKIDGKPFIEWRQTARTLSDLVGVGNWEKQFSGSA